ncbi:MAG: glycosyltransferase family 2 protein [Deltaproteobacteria bacterium]|nr:glycosyltransferase family 2 protein [Deltaproteobacteria bacterium]
MPETDIYLSIIIPAYNEAARLPKMLRRVNEYLAERPFTYEIIVVLDGPSDDTREVLGALASTVNNLLVLDCKTNRGKGRTVKRGMLAAHGRIRLFSDADNSTDISHFDKMIPLFERDFDVVIGSRHSRDAPGAGQEMPQVWSRRLMGSMGNLLIRLLAVRGIRDTQCGFKAFRDYAAEKIFSQTVIDRWGFDIEALALSRKLNYRIGVIPTRWVNDPRSHLKGRDYLSVLWETLRIQWNLFRGRYNLRRDACQERMRKR